MQQWRQNNPIKAALAHLRESARARRKGFDLTLEQFTAFIQSTGYIEHCGRNRECLQVDRMDYTRGYTLDNIQILTCSENSAKGARERFGYAWKENYPETDDGIDCPF